MPTPDVDEADLYDRLRQRREAATAAALEARRGEVLASFDGYAEGAAYSLSPMVLDSGDASALRSNYRVLRQGALADDGAQILKRSSLCCICWMRPTSELDHYLPKELFPEYATLTLNLIPSCGPCNRRKDQKYQDARGAQLFIHAYLDRLPEDEQYLHVDFDCGRRLRLDFRIVKLPNMLAETFDALSSQFEVMGLGLLYAEQSLELLADEYLSYSEVHALGGAASLMANLDRQARSVERRHGRNYWKAVLLRSAAGSVDFCDGGFRSLAVV